MGESLRLTYSEAMLFDSFETRFNYLFLGDNNVESPRTKSNPFYKSKSWLLLRKDIIARDLVCDLGLINCPIIDGRVIVHHINPITLEDVEEWNTFKLLNPENLITVSLTVHNQIHYGTERPELYFERTAGDTKLW